jgi:2-desacetyl-2-hydroxyethyl bacteriochlorophyllide A dehydrogenase
MQALQLVAPQAFQIIDLPPPQAPGPGQVLVRVRAIGICGTDVAGYLGKMPFIQYPRILGHELGVEVIAVGQGVEHIQVGDRASVEPYLSCGHCSCCLGGHTNRCLSLQVLGVHCDGGLTEQLLLPAQLIHVSNALSFEQLAMVEMLGIGCHAVNRAAVTVTDRVLIIGAGPIGLTILQFALLTGAKISMHELNPSRQEFVQLHYPEVSLTHGSPPEAEADVVFDATGHPGSMAQTFSYAAFGGRVIYVGITSQPVVLDDPLFHRRELTLLASRNSVPADFRRILQLQEEGRIRLQSWITHRAQSLPQLAADLPLWLQPDAGLVKAVISLP